MLIKKIITFPLLFSALFLSFMFSPSAVEARIVNVQDTLLSIKEDGLYVEADFSLSRTTGTSDILEVHSALSKYIKMEPHLFLLSGSASYGQKDGEPYKNKYFCHLRYRYRFWNFFMGELFGQSEYNEFRRLLIRVPCGAGPRLMHSVGNGLFSFAVGSSYMFEYIILSKDNDKNGNPYRDINKTEYNHRWNNYFAFKLVPVKFLSIGSTIYVQPRFDMFNDYMVLFESDLTFMVTKWLNISVFYALFQDMMPPQGVPHQDTSLNVSINMTFGPFFQKKKEDTLKGGEV